ERVKHIVDVIFVDIDFSLVAEEVRREYQEIIIGQNSGIVRGKVLWDRFEAAVERYLAEGNYDYDDRELTECINEIAVDVEFAREQALQDKKIEYEPAILPSGRRIDFVVDRGADNLYVEVKTVRPNAKDDDEAWGKFLHLKKHHPATLDYVVTK